MNRTISLICLTFICLMIINLSEYIKDVEHQLNSITVPEQTTINRTIVIEQPKADSEYESHLEFIGEFYCTSYCSCSLCCGEYANNRKDGIVYGASGDILIPGKSVAVDPSIIPYGTVLYIDGELYIAQDTGVSGNRIDFYCASHEEALANPNKTTDVYIVEVW